MNIATLTTTNNASRRFSGLLLCGPLSLSASFAGADTLKSIEANSLSGDGMEVRLKFEEGVPEAKGYSIEKPARIALPLIRADIDVASNQKHI